MNFHLNLLWWSLASDHAENEGQWGTDLSAFLFLGQMFLEKSALGYQFSDYDMTELMAELSLVVIP